MSPRKWAHRHSSCTNVTCGQAFFFFFWRDIFKQSKELWDFKSYFSNTDAVKSFCTFGGLVPQRIHDLYLFSFSLQHLAHQLRPFSKHVREPDCTWTSGCRPCTRISWAAWRPPITLGSRWTSSEVQRPEFIRRKIYDCVRGGAVGAVGGGGASFLPHVQDRWVYFSTLLKREMCSSVWVLHLGSVSLVGLEEKLRLTDGAADACCGLLPFFYFFLWPDYCCKRQEEK